MGSPRTSDTKEQRKSKRTAKSQHSPSEEIKAMCTHQEVSIGINFQQVSIVGIKHQASVKKAIKDMKEQAF